MQTFPGNKKKTSKTLPAKYLYAIFHYHRNKQCSSLPLFLHIKGRHGTNRNFSGQVMMVVQPRVGSAAQSSLTPFCWPEMFLNWVEILLQDLTRKNCEKKKIVTASSRVRYEVINGGEFKRLTFEIIKSVCFKEAFQQLRSNTSEEAAASSGSCLAEW